MNKKILSIIVIALLILVAYWYLNQSGSSSSESSLSTQSQVAGQSADAQNIYSLLQEMSQVQLNDGIFSNQTFTALVDNSVTLTQPPSGRSNPFAPVGQGSVVVSTSSH